MVDGGNTTAESIVNGLMRAAESIFKMLVAADGNRTRYPNGLHIGVRNERSFYTATWVVPQDNYSLVPFYGTGLF